MSWLRVRRAQTRAAEAYARGDRPGSNTPWREASYAVVDLEMTGLDPDSDEIISFASVPVDDGRIAVGETRTATVKPERMPTATTIRIHGLRPADLASAPPLERALDEILDALTGRILVAHPAWVERAFLVPALRRVGVKLKEPILCTATLAAHVLDTRERSPGRDMPLAEAARELGLPVHRPHEAAGDALTTAQLFLVLAARLDRRSPQTVGSLAKLSSG